MKIKPVLFEIEKTKDCNIFYYTLCSITTLELKLYNQFECYDYILPNTTHNISSFNLVSIEPSSKSKRYDTKLSKRS